uniref:sal-like protein 3 isoform X2 n=1 Tax=Callithrix jacchus TaxID=9483 RepID=UPI0023DD42FE|nr:sal-like protein 3 isoform X2 [Callithrix jacchus]
MLSRRAEENAFSLRVKTNHRLPCSFSSWRLESPGRPHTARRLGMFAMQRPPHSGSGSAQVAASDPGPVPRSSPAPQQPSRGGGAAAPGGRVGEPQLQRPERLIAEDPSRAHPPPQPPPPWPWGRRARFMCPGPRGAGPGVGIAAGSSSCLSAATCVWSAPRLTSGGITLSDGRQTVAGLCELAHLTHLREEESNQKIQYVTGDGFCSMLSSGLEDSLCTYRRM